MTTPNYTYVLNLKNYTVHQKNTRPFTNGMHCYENKKASEAALSLHRMFSIKFAKLLMQHPEFNNKKDSNHNIRNSKIFEEKEYAVTSSSSDSE